MQSFTASCRRSALRQLGSKPARATYATLRDLRRRPTSLSDPDEPELSDHDFILSILRANPSSRDTKDFFTSFGINPYPPPPVVVPPPPKDESLITDAEALAAKAIEQAPANAVVASILNPVQRRTALVKMQGPFTDRQLESIARGMVYLEKLGLTSVIVVEHDELERGEERERYYIMEQTMRVVHALEAQGARTRPILGAVARLGPMPGDEDGTKAGSRDFEPPEAHTLPSDLSGIRSALQAGEIPVLPPMALDSFVRSVRVDANAVIGALARGMVEAAAADDAAKAASGSSTGAPAFAPQSINLTPLRLMIINREGGVPSYARAGMPHLLVNTAQEYGYIHDTFQKSWATTHPTALSNLALARTCLAYMPPSSSAIMVSHRSPSSLIANLITNKPAVSSSLPHALLQGNRKLTPHMPTLLRRGLPIDVVRSAKNLDRVKTKKLLEGSFRRELDEAAFWTRMERDMDFAIVAGDYAGIAIVTNEDVVDGDGSFSPIAYLDKFAVLPSHQGDGTVDFLWVALHDESYGLGLPFSANPNGGKGGEGEGRDLVWRSRADNPVNKWYFDRSTGHVRMGKDWVLFWCDAEVRLKTEEGRKANAGLSYVEQWESGRLDVWARTVGSIPSVWKPKK